MCCQPSSVTKANNFLIKQRSVVFSLLIFALLGFAMLAWAVFNYPKLSLWDKAISLWFVVNRLQEVTVWVQGVSFMAGKRFILPVAMMFIAGLWFFQRKRESIGFAITMAATSVSVIGLKIVFARVRPSAEFMLGSINTAFSFPSGHTAHATVFYGLLAGLLLAKCSTAQRCVHLAVVACWLLVCAMVAVARVYLGYHWLSDVLAGFCLGVAILALAFLSWQKALPSHISFFDRANHAAEKD